MEIIDLSHPLSDETPTYPGDPHLKTTTLAEFSEKGFNTIFLEMNLHTGTHADAPYHMQHGGTTIDQMALDGFIGRGAVIHYAYQNNPKEISEEFINSQQHLLEGAEYLLFHTGWSEKYYAKDYFKEYPYFSSKAADILARNNCKGIGLDTPTPDHPDSINFPVHKLWLNTGKLIIENLTNLEQLQGRQFNFAALPLKIKGGDGSPVRAIAIIE